MGFDSASHSDSPYNPAGFDSASHFALRSVYPQNYLADNNCHFGQTDHYLDTDDCPRTDHCPDTDRFDSVLHSADGFGLAWHLLVFDCVYPLVDFDSVSDSEAIDSAFLEDFHFVFLDYDL